MEAKKPLLAKEAVALTSERADIGRAIDSLTKRRKEIDARLEDGFAAMAPNVRKFDVIAGDVKVTVEKKFNASIDHPQVDRMRKEIDPKIFPFKVEFKPIAAKMKALEQFNPELFAACKGAIIDNPGKASVKLNVNEKNTILQNGIFPKVPK